MFDLKVVNRIIINLFLVVLALSLETSAQAAGLYNLSAFWRAHNVFTWMGGPNQQTLSGIYGTQGTGSTANTPGVRFNPQTWVDSSGNFWLFGGYGFDGFGEMDDLADLWEYTPSNSQWTWVSGENYANVGLVLGSWGTKGTSSSSNSPGERCCGASWVDGSGNFWLFGGQSYDVNDDWGFMNDLWKYSPTSSQWTWISGSSSSDVSGHYGTKGTGSTSNYPGGRSSPTAWMDTSGNFWIFGGDGYDKVGSNGDLNDLWEYSPSNSKWTWISGSSLAGVAGTYGTKGTGSTSNTPGARQEQGAWTDASGNFWLFGGEGIDVNSNFGELNDLWKFAPTGSTWTWVSGASTIGASGTYGTKEPAALRIFRVVAIRRVFSRTTRELLAFWRRKHPNWDQFHGQRLE